MCRFVPYKVLKVIEAPKFLFIRFSSIGDIILTSPSLRCLKTQMPDVKIHFTTKKAYTSILKHNPYVDKIHTLGDSLNTLISELQNEHFDYIIDLHHNIRSAIVKQRLKILSFSFDKINIQKWIKVHLKIDRLPNVHIVDRYLDTLKAFGIKNDKKGLDYFIGENEAITQEQLPITHIDGYIGLVIGAKFATKRMPTDKLISICNTLQYPIALLGGFEDQSRGNEICAKTNNAKVWNTCGQFSLNQSASLIQEANHIITHDTGLMHIAAAFNKPITSIWGNTIPQLGMYAYLPDTTKNLVQNIEVKNLSCRPCSKIGFAQCPKKHFKCMNEISVNEICSTIHFTSNK